MVGSPQLLWGLYKCKKAVSVCFISCISDEAKLRNPFQCCSVQAAPLLFTELVCWSFKIVGTSTALQKHKAKEPDQSVGLVLLAGSSPALVLNSRSASGCCGADLLWDRAGAREFLVSRDPYPKLRFAFFCF